jgi:hypothetical protein
MSEETPRAFYSLGTTVIILARIGKGESLHSICAEAGMPSRQSWQRWCAEDSVLNEKYVRAQANGLLARANLAHVQG